MKKKILGLFMILAFIFTIGMSNVSAAVLSWDTILTDYKNIIANEKFEVTSDATSLNISYSEFKHGPYSIKINYDDTNKKISYISTRDTTGFTDEQMVDYGSADMYFLSMLMLDLFKLYNIDMEKLPDTGETDDMNQYGFILDSKEVSYKDETGTTTVTYPNSFTIDLNKFDQSTVSFQNTLTDTTVYDNLILGFKALLDPTSSTEDSDWVLGEGVVEGIIGGTSESTNQQTEIKQEEVVVKEDTTNEKNPQTGLKNVGLGILVVGLISLISYLVIRNKKIFVK